MFFGGRARLGVQRIETALDMAEARSLPEVLSQALTTKAIMLDRARAHRRRAGAAALRARRRPRARQAVGRAARVVQPRRLLSQSDRYEEAATTVRDGLVARRRVGNRHWEWSFLGQVYPLFALGEWDEVLARCAVSCPRSDWTLARLAFAGVAATVVPIHVHRGELAEAEDLIELLAELENSADIQERAQFGWARQGCCSPGEAHRGVGRGWGLHGRARHVGISSESIKEAFAVAMEATIELGDLDKAGELLSIVDALPPGRSPQFLAGSVRALPGRPRRSERRARGGRTPLQACHRPFSRAVHPLLPGGYGLEYAEQLIAEQRRNEAEPLLVEAREIFERLGAQPWLDRLSASSGRREVAGLRP